jgi:hypothetical protein
MNFVPDVTTKSIAVMGGLLARGAAVIAQATTDPSVGTSSFLLGGAGLIAAISAFTRDYWTDRQKQRDHELSLVKIKLRACRTCTAVHELYNWAKAAHAAVPGLPVVPEFRLDSECGAGTGTGTDTENGDA